MRESVPNLNSTGSLRFAEETLVRNVSDCVDLDREPPGRARCRVRAEIDDGLDAWLRPEFGELTRHGKGKKRGRPKMSIGFCRQDLFEGCRVPPRAAFRASGRWSVGGLGGRDGRRRGTRTWAAGQVVTGAQRQSPPPVSPKSARPEWGTVANAAEVGTKLLRGYA